ncbi:hypothetical protein [Pseudomonas brenneri]|uniref:Uncharacterized protein n=1 Tax=Pseudomonas brenneri TaxID=129817 RepID=A0A5B2UXC4_9PSED|nr:hypothetical protein [Pseudomonas brenneri]KAA2230527.1 hypothetical protein F1720_11090 [Pseudomonas brenneri]TWR77403.1 hypothetical protein FJD34_17135 [Pseudomonas brenneri]SDU96523.1 hypothetical protein SAMN04490181_2269 [Pseudomonas brenneri]
MNQPITRDEMRVFLIVWRCAYTERPLQIHYRVPTMGRYKSLLIAIALFVAAWFLLLSATAGVPENPADLSDTSGLPPVTIYAVALQAIGIVAIIVSVLGMLASYKIRSVSFGFRLAVFWVSNALLVLASLLGVFVIASYVLGTISGVAGVALYIASLALVVIAAPKRVTIKHQP